MEKFKDLSCLLALCLYELNSAEEQVAEVLPAMVEKASDSFLKTVLEEHLPVTREHIRRLAEIKQLMTEQAKQQAVDNSKMIKALLGGTGSRQPAYGMAGLIKAGKKMLKQHFAEAVMDAAVIGSAQQIAHFEIASYGTALAYAHQLDLQQVATLLETTLAEEYAADDRLSDLALGGLNEEADEPAGEDVWMHAGRPAAVELDDITPKITPEDSSRKKKAAPKSTRKSQPAKSKRPSAKVTSPGGRAGTSHRERPGH